MLQIVTKKKKNHTDTIIIISDYPQSTVKKFSFN